MEAALPSAEDEALARKLTALSNAGRLALLRQLRSPKVITEMRLLAADGDTPPRPISRQAVREHLLRLVDVGVVATREAERTWGAASEYAIDHRAIFAIAEEFRALARLRPSADLDAPTVEHAPSASASDTRGPALILVKGLDEGRAFDLDAPRGGERRWTIGRSRTCDVALDYDPFVSSINALVEREGAQRILLDEPDSRNGTTVNYRPLPKGARHVLRTGDLVGVGRSTLMFRE